jgi:Cation transporter/ATPase, N-terminus
MALLHQPLWTLSFEEVYESLGTAADGLSEDEAQERLEKFGANELPEPAHENWYAASHATGRRRCLRRAYAYAFRRMPV